MCNDNVPDTDDTYVLLTRRGAITQPFTSFMYINLVGFIKLMYIKLEKVE